MYCLKFFKFSLILFFVSGWAGASEAPPQGEHGAKPPEGGKPAVVEKEYSGRQNDEWQKIQKDLQSAKMKMVKQEEDLKALVRAAEHKQGNITTEELKVINEARKVLNELKTEYKRLNHLYELRFPEKGLEIGRKYNKKSESAEIESVNVVEKQQMQVFTLDQRLKILNAKLKSRYKKIKPVESQSSLSGSVLSEHVAQQTTSGTSEVKSKNDDITRKIKIKK